MAISGKQWQTVANSGKQWQTVSSGKSAPLKLRIRLLLFAQSAELAFAPRPTQDTGTLYEAQTALANLPRAERQSCAFLRVWCLVELAAALAQDCPLIMLIGET